MSVWKKVHIPKWFLRVACIISHLVLKKWNMMHACVCVHMCVHVSCIHVCAWTCAWMCVCMCLHVYVCMCMHVCACICVCMCHASMCVHVYVCMCMCVRIFRTSHRMEDRLYSDFITTTSTASQWLSLNWCFLKAQVATSSFQLQKPLVTWIASNT